MEREQTLMGILLDGAVRRMERRGGLRHEIETAELNGARLTVIRGEGGRIQFIHFSYPDETEMPDYGLSDKAGDPHY
jgi:hypothetical protein